jgi:hypothetical protein
MNQQQRFIKFVNERQSITDKRAKDLPKPWTKDPILQTYRFCSVQREDDRVTKWIAKHWRGEEQPEVWFAMVVARHINAPATLEHLGYPVPWNKRHFYKVIRERQKNDQRIYNAAYMIVPRQTSMPKDEYLAERMFSPMWKERNSLRPTTNDTLQSFYERISQFWGMGTFMSAQVIADLKYVGPLDKAKDWWTFAKSGPGSRRGMNRVLGRPKNTGITETFWYEELMKLQKATKSKIPKIHAQDLQNCLCEFDKYERVRTGEGVPKQKYKGID